MLLFEKWLTDLAHHQAAFITGVPEFSERHYSEPCLFTKWAYWIKVLLDFHLPFEDIFWRCTSSLEEYLHSLLVNRPGLSVAIKFCIWELQNYLKVYTHDSGNVLYIKRNKALNFSLNFERRFLIIYDFIFQIMPNGGTGNWEVKNSDLFGYKGWN